MKKYWTAVALITAAVTSCGHGAPIETSSEMAGLPSTDIQQILARDDTKHDSREAQLQSL